MSILKHSGTGRRRVAIWLAGGAVLLPALTAAALSSPGAAAATTTTAPAAVEAVSANDDVDPGPVAELSTETSTTEREADGSYTATLYGGPVNYEDDSGDWVPISNDLVEAPGDAYAVENEANAYTVSIPEDPSTTPIRFEVDGAWVKIRIGDAEDIEPQVTGTEATFEDIAGADEITYEATDSGLKETIILDSPPESAPNYMYTLRTSDGITPVMTPDGTVEFRDDAGDPQFFIPVGIMSDADNPEPAYSQAVDFALEPNGTAWTFTVTPDMGWLTNPARVYPVAIDPTINTFVQKSCWLQEESPTANHCGETYLKVGNNDNLKSRRGLVDFGINAIPGNAVISTATADFYLNAGWTTGAGGATSYALFNPSKAWSNGANWNQASSGNSWTGGGSQAQISTNTHSLGGTTSAWKAWTITGRVQGWVNGSYENRGIMIRQVDPENTKKVLGFVSQTHAATYLRPYMRVTYDLPPSTPSGLGFSPCLDACNPNWRFTDSSTPTLYGLATDSDSPTLDYTFQIRREDDASLVVEAAVPQQQDQPAYWLVPTGKLINEMVYEFRLGVSDGTSQRWSAWKVIGVDLDEKPLPPQDVLLSPCLDDSSCDTITTLEPTVSTIVLDPDTAVLEARIEVRSALTMQPIWSKSSVVQAGARTDFQLPAQQLLDNETYEFRTGAADNSSLVWSTWSQFHVDVPGTFRPPINLTLQSCVNPCDVWTTATTMPTFTASRGDSLAGSRELRYEVMAQNGGLYDATLNDIGVGEVATWSVEPGVLQSGTYAIRAGVVDSGDVRWTGWTHFDVSDTAPDGTGSAAADEGNPTTDVEFDPNVSPDAAQDLEDFGTPSNYGEQDVDALQPAITADAQRAIQLGLSSDYESSAVNRAVPIWVKYSPRMKFHSLETSNPLSARTFINHSTLRWSHDGNCNDHRFARSPNPGDLSGTRYSRHAAYSFPLCGVFGNTLWHSTDNVRPRENGGPGGAEGMFLDLDQDMRSGGDFKKSEPVYVRYRPFKSITYWFHWGESQLPLGLTTRASRHEGDWERIAIKLNISNNTPERVQYFYHETSCTLAWDDVPVFKGTHPDIWVAWQGHGSYPANSVAGDSGHGWRDAINGGGDVWYANNNPQLVDEQDWWGYDGGWGEVGETARTTGPDGPSARRDASDAPSFGTQACVLQSS